MRQILLDTNAYAAFKRGEQSAVGIMICGLLPSHSNTG